MKPFFKYKTRKSKTINHFRFINSRYSKLIYLFIGLLIIIGSYFLVFALEDSKDKELVIQISSFELNKEVYSSYEDVSFKIVIDSSSRVDNAELNIKGIKLRNIYYLHVSEAIDLKKGTNNFLLRATTPRCTSGCGGVNPGDYELVASLVINESVFSEIESIITLVS